MLWGQRQKNTGSRNFLSSQVGLPWLLMWHTRVREVEAQRISLRQGHWLGTAGIVHRAAPVDRLQLAAHTEGRGISILGIARVESLMMASRLMPLPLLLRQVPSQQLPRGGCENGICSLTTRLVFQRSTPAPRHKYCTLLLCASIKDTHLHITAVLLSSSVWFVSSPGAWGYLGVLVFLFPIVTRAAPGRHAGNITICMEFANRG